MNRDIFKNIYNMIKDSFEKGMHGNPDFFHSFRKNFVWMNLIKCSLGMLLVLFASCSDSFLDTSSPSEQTNETTFSSTFFTEAAVQGLYSYMATEEMYSCNLSMYYNNNSDIETDQLKYFSQLSTSQYSFPNYYTDKYYNNSSTWTTCYSMIEQATEIIEGVRSSALLETEDSTVMKAHLGEALTTRALGYFELVKVWGDVPFRRTTSTSSNLYEGKVDRDTIYKYILDDLIEAADYLPWMGSSAGDITFTAERITKGFAKGLAARIALFAGGWSVRDGNIFTYQSESLEHNTEIAEMNGYFVGRVKNYLDYYAIAAQQCAEIIGSSDNPHGLDDYENLWKTVNQLQLNSVNENLFEVATGMGENSEIGVYIGYDLANGTSYGERGLPSQYIRTNIYYFYSFDSLDERRDITLTNIFYTADSKYYKGSAGSEGEAFGNGIYDWNFAKWRYSWMTSAYLALVKATTTSRVGSGINYIVMRYPDVLLMYAEAMYGLYNDPDKVNATAKISARTALETVRARAFSTHTSEITAYTSDFLEAIKNERAWEFGGEGLRKYDLIRWGDLSSKIEKQKEATCLLMNGNKDVTIFDKTYVAGTLPTTVYYNYVTGSNLINRSSINYLGDAKTTSYSSTWLSEAAGGKNIASNARYVLLQSSGLNASYDPSAIVSQMDSSVAITKLMNTYETGNGVCNYRHPLAFYYSIVSPTNGTLVNSYGY